MNMMDYSRQFFLNARELEIVEELDKKEQFFLNVRELEIVEELDKKEQSAFDC